MLRKKRRDAPFTEEGVMHATINGHRFHLRSIDPTEDNYLWIDGQPPLVLDRVAAEFVGYLIQGMWKFQQGEGDESDRVVRYAVENMYRRYGKLLALPKQRATRRRIREDFHRIVGTLMGIAEGTCPVEAGLEGKEISPAAWAAPARMDLALTYRCNLACGKCYVGVGQKDMPELPSDLWKEILRRLWSIGVPQVVFTGGEPTLKQDLVPLIKEAEQFVTGLVTNGTLLAGLAESLQDASLDYVQITVESSDPEIHDRMAGKAGVWQLTVEGIKKAIELGMQAITNTTLTRINAPTFGQLIRFGADLGLKYMACNGLICSGRGREERKQNGLTEEELKAVLVEAIGLAEERGIALQWYSPTCYNRLDPVALGLGAKGCSAAAGNMTIQPDGTVLPCQSWPEPVGRILQDPWEAIWNHETCRKLRDHLFAQAECDGCTHFSLCGGGCPLENREGRRP